jgi:hypothetical protein
MAIEIYDFHLCLFSLAQCVKDERFLIVSTCLVYGLVLARQQLSLGLQCITLSESKLKQALIKKRCFEDERRSPLRNKLSLDISKKCP